MSAAPWLCPHGVDMRSLYPWCFLCHPLTFMTGPRDPSGDLPSVLLHEALRALTDVSPWDEDPEGLGGTWCHFCQHQEPKHEEHCDWERARSLLGER